MTVSWGTRPIRLRTASGAEIGGNADGQQDADHEHDNHHLEKGEAIVARKPPTTGVE